MRSPAITTHEASELIQAGTGPSGNGLTANRALNINLQRIHCLVSMRGLLAQGLRNNRVEITA